MTTNPATPNNRPFQASAQAKLASSYYALLGLHPSASMVEIRRSYRELSKQYHPDTTELVSHIAKEKFQEINEAYATLSNPERRRLYDQKIGYSRLYVVQTSTDLYRPASEQQPYRSSSAYLDPTDRPLSAGEIFALFILALTFVGCLGVAIAIALTHPETALKPLALPSEVFPELFTL